MPLTKINSKWVKDLQLRPSTLKVLQENIGERSLSFSIGNDFLNITPKAGATKARDKQNYIKLRSFCTRKIIK